MPKVLIFYTAHSKGHQAIAQNFAFWFRSLGWNVVLADAFGVYAEDQTLNSSLRFNLFVYKHLALVWKWLYQWGYVLFLPFRTLFSYRYTQKILSIIQEESPDLVVTTHAAPSAVLSGIKQRRSWKGKWAIGFSDYHFHPFWLHAKADGYLVNIEEQQEMLLASGVSFHAITRNGMWLTPRPVISPEAVKAQLDIDFRAKVLLVGGGSGGWMKLDQLLSCIDEVIKKARASQQQVVPVFVCGSNRELLEQVRSQRPEWIALPFYENMHELYAIADVFLTKPGGLSIAESLQWRLPCIVPFVIQGQESLNMKYLLRNRLVISLLDKSEDLWPNVIYDELSSGAFRRLLEQHAAVQKVVGENSHAKLSVWLDNLFRTGGGSV